MNTDLPITFYFGYLGALGAMASELLNNIGFYF